MRKLRFIQEQNPWLLLTAILLIGILACLFVSTWMTQHHPRAIERTYASIKRGMPRDEVHRLLGRGKDTREPLSNCYGTSAEEWCYEAWTWDRKIVVIYDEDYRVAGFSLESHDVSAFDFGTSAFDGEK